MTRPNKLKHTTNTGLLNLSTLDHAVNVEGAKLPFSPEGKYDQVDAFFECFVTVEDKFAVVVREDLHIFCRLDSD